MGKQATTLESKSKHLTNTEKQAMTDAESDFLPNRAGLPKPPRFLTKEAKSYWRQILKRMEGLAILDILDAEMLGVYCQMLARRDEIQEMLNQQPGDVEPKDWASLEGKLQPLERNLLAYAEKLGLTPGGRVALARRAAAQALDPNPMFGD